MSAAATVTVTTPTCHVCDRGGEVTVPLDGLLARQAGALIQVAFPDLDPALREQFKTGTHPVCYRRMLGQG